MIKESARKEIIDGLLDDYNQFMALYELFGDEVYKERAEKVIETLRLHIQIHVR
ncbi:hypothetical protein BSNK01_30680 [Bacillaceae bacterium]